MSHPFINFKVLLPGVLVLASLVACTTPTLVSVPEAPAEQGSEPDNNSSEDKESAESDIAGTPDNTGTSAPAPVADPKPEPTPAPTPTPIPTPIPTSTPLLSSNFTSATGPALFPGKSVTMDANFFAYAKLGGASVLAGVSQTLASDGFVAKLLFPGNPALGSADKAGPGDYGTHLESDQGGKLFQYGTYRTRFKAASCATTAEGVVTGVFTYQNDGTDKTKNGLIDNSEIDIEVLCAEPSVLHMTVWTDYTNDTEGNFAKTTRKIDLTTGKYSQTTPGKEGYWGLGTKGVLATTFAGLNFTTQFVEIGFTWKPDSVRYFLVKDGVEHELWILTGSSLIPQNPGAFMVNLWHNQNHWHNDLPADYPTTDAVTEVDSFMYFAP